MCAYPGNFMWLPVETRVYYLLTLFPYIRAANFNLFLKCNIVYL